MNAGSIGIRTVGRRVNVGPAGVRAVTNSGEIVRAPGVIPLAASASARFTGVRYARRRNDGREDVA